MLIERINQNENLLFQLIFLLNVLKINSVKYFNWFIESSDNEKDLKIQINF